MHILWWVNRTHTHDIIHASMNNREIIAAYIISSYYGVPWVKNLQCMDICPIIFSESVLCEFSILSTGGQGPCFGQSSASAWPLWMNWRMDAAFFQEVSQQEVRYKEQENETSATIGTLL